MGTNCAPAQANPPELPDEVPLPLLPDDELELLPDEAPELLPDDELELLPDEAPELLLELPPVDEPELPELVEVLAPLLPLAPAPDDPPVAPVEDPPVVLEDAAVDEVVLEPLDPEPPVLPEQPPRTSAATSTAAPEITAPGCNRRGISSSNPGLCLYQLLVRRGALACADSTDVALRQFAAL